MKDISDIDIIESVKRGNQADFALLINRYKNKAFSLLCRMLKNEMEAEEVLQDCFLKTYNSLGSFKQEAKFSTWFYRIVYNTALTRLNIKKRKIETEMESISEELEVKSDYDFNVTERKDFSEFINNIVQDLPPKYASVINMFYLNEMSCEEIAEVMNLTLSNVKLLLYRSRNALRELLESKKFSVEFL